MDGDILTFSNLKKGNKGLCTNYPRDFEVFRHTDRRIRNKIFHLKKKKKKSKEIENNMICAANASEFVLHTFCNINGKTRYPLIESCQMKIVKKQSAHMPISALATFVNKGSLKLQNILDMLKIRIKHGEGKMQQKPLLFQGIEGFLQDQKIVTVETKTGSHYGSIQEKQQKGMPP